MLASLMVCLAMWFAFTVITARASSTAEVGIVTIGSVNVVPAANGAAKVAVLTTV